MAKKLDPAIGDVLKKYGFGPEACWDCHGTWVVYHRVLEQIAAKAGIVFDRPQVIEADGKNKSVALCVAGSLMDREEWSVGEASPANNKNSYPYVMAEKRAKDRVILKLIGLHGLAYSEDEADDFKEGKPPAKKDATPFDPETGEVEDDPMLTVALSAAKGGTNAMKAWVDKNRSGLPEGWLEKHKKRLWAAAKAADQGWNDKEKAA